jgi:hypothetical protein
MKARMNNMGKRVYLHKNWKLKEGSTVIIEATAELLSSKITPENPFVMECRENNVIIAHLRGDAIDLYSFAPYNHSFLPPNVLEKFLFNKPHRLSLERPEPSKRIR